MLRRWGAAALLISSSSLVWAQSRLPQFPGWEQHTKNRPQLSRAISLAGLRGGWTVDSRYAWQEGSEWVVLDPKTGLESKHAERPQMQTGGGRRGAGSPGRGRQFREAASPDGTTRAVSRDNNVFLVTQGGEKALTQDGSPVTKIKYGQASWVYGEELDQSEAMGFSPDGQKLWFYRFDESQVLDYHLAVNQQSSQTSLEVEAYPKPGTPNPTVDIMIADVKTGSVVRVQARPGQFDDGMGHYLYRIRWSPNGQWLLFHRMDRKQKAMEFCRADPLTGQVTVLDREENPDAWVESHCPTLYLDELPGIEDKPAFKGKVLWMSERSGWLNLYLLDLEKGGVTPVTKNAFDVRQVWRVDFQKEKVWFMANSSSSGRKQLHWASLDGKRGARVTNPDFDHLAVLSPNSEWFVSRSQNVSSPPEVALYEASGKKIKVLGQSSVEGMASLGYRPVEGFTYLAADGKTQLQGALHYPANFDPSQKYPVVFQVYGGPLGPMSDAWNDVYRTPDNMTDFGFFVVEAETRGGGGRGRLLKNTLYQKLGITEIDDLAEAAKWVSARPSVDPERIGIEGTSYGGYATLMALGRYPQLFRAGAAQSCVSQWANYDTTYTERFMGLLPESEAFYRASSALTYAPQVKGWLMLYYGTSDDNTHPANTLQMVKALQQAGKTFEVQVGVDVGHSGMNFRRMMEFFIERLKLPERALPLP